MFDDVLRRCLPDRGRHLDSGKGQGVAVPVAGRTAAQSLAALLQTLQTSPACVPSPLLATQSAFAACSIGEDHAAAFIPDNHHHLSIP